MTKASRDEMLYQISDIRGERADVERQYPAAAFDAEAGEYTVADPVSLTFEAVRKGDEVRLGGRVETILTLTCGRCAEGYRFPVRASFNLRYLPQSANTGEGEREIEKADLSTAYYEDDAIDLRRLMVEQFYLVLPMKPLCRDSCQGLCPQCGVNRNQASCSCASDWADPRWAGLASWSARRAADVSADRNGNGKDE